MALQKNMLAKTDYLIPRYSKALCSDLFQIFTDKASFCTPHHQTRRGADMATYLIERLAKSQ